MNLILAVNGATGAWAAELLLKKSPWPVTLVASEWGKAVVAREGGDFARLAQMADKVFDDADLAAPISSGSIPTLGMIVLPCSANTLAKVAHGISDSLITRAAHCHLKERRRLVLCVRETPWSLIDCQNAAAVSAAGGVVMPLSPPFYQMLGRDPATVTMTDLLNSYVDRVLALFGHAAAANWETVS
ncbi:MAG: UbiX family flavin prenyltransferase [Verrucomicrobia bacterium]|nr:MAG: UbiX family flavin prenyltransferase [Verrucomicrobiota bacterium]